MTNNDVLRSLRYILNVPDSKLAEILKLADCTVSLQDVSSFLKKDDEAGFKGCPDQVLAQFLNGLVTYRRGPRTNEDSRPPPDEPMTNNVVLKKLRVAFELKDDDIVAIIEKSGIKIVKTELSAFFRKPDHRNYRDCGDQFLRNFLKGLTVKPI